MRRKTSDQIQQGIESLRHALPKAFDERTLKEAIYQAAFPQEKQISESTQYHLLASAKKIPLIWNKRTVGQLYTLSDDLQSLDLVAAWTKRRWYLSHYPALYWNELIDQKPTEFYLSADLHLRSSPARKNVINPGLIPMAFAKAHRRTQNFCAYDKSKFFFLERAFSNEAGVYKKEINSGNRSVEIRLTSIERTLVDCVVEPQYSGGMATVVKAFSNAESFLDINRLYEIYKELNLTYPYWQTIGFILTLTNALKAQQWANKFEKPKLDFYFDRMARSDWNFSETWRIYYPRGLVRE